MYATCLEAGKRADRGCLGEAGEEIVDPAFGEFSTRAGECLQASFESRRDFRCKPFQKGAFGHAELHAGERNGFERSRRLAGHDRIGRRAVCDRARERADGIEAGGKREGAFQRYAAGGRLEADEALQSSRNAHRAAAVRADGDLARALCR